MFFLHILILYHLLEEVIFTLYYLYTTTIARMIAMELVEGLTEEERRILAIEYFSDTTGEVSNAFKCRRSRLRRKIEESLGIFRKKRR